MIVVRLKGQTQTSVSFLVFFLFVCFALSALFFFAYGFLGFVTKSKNSASTYSLRKVWENLLTSGKGFYFYCIKWCDIILITVISLFCQTTT